MPSQRSVTNSYEMEYEAGFGFTKPNNIRTSVIWFLLLSFNFVGLWINTKTFKFQIKVAYLFIIFHRICVNTLMWVLSLQLELFSTRLALGRIIKFHRDCSALLNPLYRFLVLPFCLFKVSYFLIWSWG